MRLRFNLGGLGRGGWGGRKECGTVREGSEERNWEGRQGDRVEGEWKEEREKGNGKNKGRERGRKGGERERKRESEGIWEMGSGKRGKSREEKKQTRVRRGGRGSEKGAVPIKLVQGG